MRNKYRNMTVLTVPIGADLVEPSGSLSQLQDHAVRNGAKPVESGANVLYPIRQDFCVKDAVLLTQAVGGSVKGYRPVFEVDSLDDEVPAAFSSRTYIDENEVEQVHTWATWATRQTLPDYENGKRYVMSDAHGSTPPVSEILASGLTLITKAEWNQAYRAWLAANPQPEE